MGYIYKITNKVNQKVYIGLTTLTIEKRWKTHLQAAFNPNSKDYNALFKKAIRKYGPENFIYEQIDETDDLDELKNKEIYWIDYYNSYAFEEGNWGYNSTRGGDGVVDFNNIPIVQCNILTGELVKEYPSIKQAERELGRRICSISTKNHSSKGYCFLYKFDIEDLTEEEIKKVIHSQYPTLVYQLDLEGNFIKLYRNTTEAAKSVEGSQGNLIMCCLGQRRLMKGYQWVYQRDIEDRIGKPVKDLSAGGLAVIQYGLNGKKIKEWDNISTAAKELKIQDTHISSCCKGKRKQCGGYQWRYTDDELEEVPQITTKRKVVCLETLEIFDTPNHAAKHFNYSQQTVKKCCETGRTTKPYHFAWYDREDDINATI